MVLGSSRSPRSRIEKLDEEVERLGHAREQAERDVDPGLRIEEAHRERIRRARPRSRGEREVEPEREPGGEEPAALAQRDAGLREQLGLPELRAGLVREQLRVRAAERALPEQHALGEVELGLRGGLARQPRAVPIEARAELPADVRRQLPREAPAHPEHRALPGQLVGVARLLGQEVDPGEHLGAPADRDQAVDPEQHHIGELQLGRARRAIAGQEVEAGADLVAELDLGLGRELLRVLGEHELPARVPGRLRRHVVLRPGGAPAGREHEQHHQRHHRPARPVDHRISCRPRARLRRGVERALEVGLQIGDVLDADRQPDEAVDDAELLAVLRPGRSRAS